MLATLVVIDHALTELGSGALGLAPSIAVVMFFVLSDLVLTRGWPGDFRLFLVRRFVRLRPIFAISLTVFGLLAWRVPAGVRVHLATISALRCQRALSADVVGVHRSLDGFGNACRRLVGARWPVTHAGLHDLECGAGDLLAVGACGMAGADVLQRLFCRRCRTVRHSALLERTPLQWLGRISYSLYPTHWLVLRAATKAFGPAGTLLGIIASFVMAEIVWRYVENPSIRLSRRISFSRRG